jgi:phosphatidylglycerophosphate synthase
MIEHLESSTTKYEDASKYESFADNYIFFPISDLLVTPLRKIGLTPNNVTILSSLFTLSTIYFLHINKIEYACAMYFIGYLLDCVDGNMARKYNMGSKYGMALDMLSDQITTIILLAYILLTKEFKNYWLLLVIIILMFLCSISVSIAEAFASYKKTGTDNFYKNKEEELAGENAKIYKLYLHTNKISYNMYKTLFPNYNEEKLMKYMSLLKEFGPGNANLFGIGVLYYLYT